MGFDLSRVTDAQPFVYVEYQRFQTDSIQFLKMLTLSYNLYRVRQVKPWLEAVIKTDSPKRILIIVILRPFLVIFLSTTLISFTELGFKHVKYLEMTV